MKHRAHKCPECGAPLQVSAADANIQCGYCRTVVAVAHGPKPAAPPPIPTPPTIYFEPERKSAVSGVLGVVLAVALIAAIPILIGAVTCVGSRISSWVSSKTLRFPVSCGANEELVIDGRTESGAGTLVSVGSNCKVILRGCRLSGDTTVKLADNAEIYIEDSVIEGKAEAIRAGSSAKIRVTQSSTIRGKTAGVRADTNLWMSVERSQVLSDDIGVRAEGNAKITSEGGEIQGGKVSLSLAEHSEVKLLQSTVGPAGEVGIQAKHLRATLEGSRIGGKDVAVKVESATLDLKEKSSLQATNVALVSQTNTNLTLEESSADNAIHGVQCGGNCKVQLRQGSSVRAKSTGISATSHNLEVSLEQSVLEAGEQAIRGADNLTVTVSKASTLQARKLAIGGGVNVTVTLDGITVDNVDAFVQGNYNLHIFLLNKSRIRARDVGISGQMNVEVKVDQSSLEAGNTAIRSGNPAALGMAVQQGSSQDAVRSRIGRIEGVGGHNTKLTEINQSVVQGGKTGVFAGSLDLNLQGSKLLGGDTAVFARTVTVEASSSEIRGGRLAFDLESKPWQMTLVGSTVSGGQQVRRP